LEEVEIIRWNGADRRAGDHTVAICAGYRTSIPLAYAWSASFECVVPITCGRNFPRKYLPVKPPEAINSVDRFDPPCKNETNQHAERAVEELVGFIERFGDLAVPEGVARKRSQSRIVAIKDLAQRVQIALLEELPDELRHIATIAFLKCQGIPICGRARLLDRICL
jgi:hypothetical protein